MLPRILIPTLTAAAAVLMVAPAVGALQAQDELSDRTEYYDRVRIDRYLAAEIWTNHSDGEYYDGDNVVIHFRCNRDAFVAIYSIDSRGHVNMLFPADAHEDNYIYGGVTYSLPGKDDKYDLVVTGPPGVENLQIVAARERFPIPDWQPASGLVCDWEDRHEYMDYLNRRYFVGYDGQEFSYDRSAIYINEWEPVYFRPIYTPYYPTWTVCGNMYIDYPIGGTIYIDGVYWGVAPLYIPRIYVGWHTISVYDHWGYCWEHDLHITRYNTIVLDHHIVRPLPTVVSKYKTVRTVGYRDPGSHGYADFAVKKAKVVQKATAVTVQKDRPGSAGKKEKRVVLSSKKQYAKGTSELVKTERGLESSSVVPEGRSQYRTGKTERSNSRKVKVETQSRTESKVPGGSERSSFTKPSDRSSGGKSSDGRRVITKDAGSSRSKQDSQGSGYYQKKRAKKPSASGKTQKRSIRSKSDRGSKSGSSKSGYKQSKPKTSSGSSYRKSSGGSGARKSGSSSAGSKSSGSKSGGSKSTGSSKQTSGGKKRR